VTARIALLATLLMIGLTIVGFRAYQVQVSPRSKDFEDAALQNQTRVEAIPAPRGRFLDRKGRVLAENRRSIDVFLVDPRRAPEGSSLIRLARILGMSIGELKSKMPKRKTVGYYIPDQIKEEIGTRAYLRLREDKIHLPSIVPREVVVRHYLFETLACHLMGRVGRIPAEAEDAYMAEGYHPDEVVGTAGLEKKYQEILRGARGIRSTQVDALGWPKGEKLVSPAKPGGDVHLTLDVDVQLATERALGSRRGSIAVVDPKTGDILALASSPRFDPNHFNRKVSAEEWGRLANSWQAPLLNRSTEASYQPGSTFKVIVALAALQANVSPEETVFCSGQFRLGPRIAKCWKKSGHGHIAMERALAHSCNVYFYTMGLRAGIDRIERISRALGLGRRTGIDVGGETPGVMPGPDYRKERKLGPWTKGDTVNVAIGQGEVLSTPLQMARAIGAIENRGVLLKSRLVKSTLKDGVENRVAPAVASEVKISEQHLEVVRAGMRGAVARGTAVRTRIKGLDIYGKTGSAQNPAGDTHAWFVGVMRAPGGSVALAVCLENAGGGGKEAAPLAKKVFAALLENGWDARADEEVAGAERTAEETAPPVPRREALGEVDLAPPEEVQEVPDSLALFDPGVTEGEAASSTETAEAELGPLAAAPPPVPSASPSPSPSPTPEPTPKPKPKPRVRRRRPRRPKPKPKPKPTARSLESRPPDGDLGGVDPDQVGRDLAPLGPPPSLRDGE
jgi:penicillin-binding protein 2